MDAVGKPRGSLLDRAWKAADASARAARDGLSMKERAIYARAWIAGYRKALRDVGPKRR